MKKPPPIFAIFFTVFMDMMAFGMAIPDLQLRAEHLGAQGGMIGLLQSTFSITQFFTAPLLGRLSDQLGRRPILIATCALSVACFLMYSQAYSLPILVISRILAGLAGANIGVAYAYIADITPPEERAKGMGIVGAAFGLGFIFGPATGALLIRAGNDQPTLLGLIAAGLALLNLIFVVTLLPEPNVHRAPAAVSMKENLKQLGRAVREPGLGTLVILFFVANFAFSNLESTFFLLCEHQYRFADPKFYGSLVLVWVGIIAAIMQGGLIRKLVPRFGEVKLMRAGYLLQVPALAMVPFPYMPLLWPSILAVCAFLGIGSGIASPSVTALISRSVPDDMQGGTAGITQSAGALARIFGPLAGTSLFAKNPSWPYAAAAILMLIPSLMALRFQPHDASKTASAVS